MTKALVAVIGTAGRKSDEPKVSREIFHAMMKHCKSKISEQFRLDPSNVILVSGGSAWADHVAVRLYLETMMDDEGNAFAGLHIYMPCIIDYNDSTKKIEFESNHCGQELDNLHTKFNITMGNEFDSMKDLYAASKLGASIHESHKGFFARNTAIATCCNYLIAYTFGDNEQKPKQPGGTWDTWMKCPLTDKKLHFPISRLATNSVQVTEQQVEQVPVSRKRKLKDYYRLDSEPKKQKSV